MPARKTGGTNSEVSRKRMRGLDMRKSKQDAWSKNDDKLYKAMGGKAKTKYAEDQATYREFGRTYGGPTDATSVSTRKRREAGNYSFGEKPKKAMGKSKSIPKKVARKKPVAKKAVSRKKAY